MFGLAPWRKERTRALSPRPEEPFRLMRRELDELFNRFFGAWGFPLEEPWTPEMGLEVEEKEKEYLIRAEVPGFAAEEIAVELSGDVLTITARHEEKVEKEEEKGKEKAPAEKSARYSELTRSVTLPPTVDPAKIEAAYKHGVLEIHIPRAPEAMPRKIPVKT
jgi:HSP20 family protein